MGATVSPGRLLTHLALSFAVLLVTPTSPALAFFDQFRVDPAVPSEDASFLYRFRTGQCHGVHADSPQPIALTRTGDVLELTVGIIDNSFSPSFCNIPIAAGHRYTIPALPAGNYRIDLYTVDVPNNPNVRVLRSQLPFQVVAGAPAPQAVPANASWAVLLLSLMVGALALRRLAN